MRSCSGSLMPRIAAVVVGVVDDAEMADDQPMQRDVPPAPKYTSAKRWLRRRDDVGVADVATAVPGADDSSLSSFGVALAAVGAVYLAVRRFGGRRNRRGL